MNRKKKFILWFDELSIKDVPLVGGKNASLGEMYRKLTRKGVKVPNGFAVTAYAYQYLLIKAGIKNKIKKIVNSINVKNVKDLENKAKELRKIIFNAEFPDELTKAIIDAYSKLCKTYGKNTDVAVRSSATAEDLPTASFAGQQETYLNIRGEKQLIEACKKCFASLFTARAISYRVENKFDHMKVYLSIGVQKMVRSSSSGVMFTIDTESGFRDVVFINASYGLGENIVQGKVNPDEYYVFKKTMNKYRPIIRKNIGAKKIKMIYTKTGTKNINTSEKERKNFVLKDDEILKLAKWGCIIEEHYKKPMDIEWAKDKELYIVQARPETVQSQKKMNVLEDYEMIKKGQVLCVGKSVGAKVGQGIANVIKNVRDIKKFRKEQVLVTEMTDPDWEPIMKIASAIVTNKGGRTCFTGDTKILTNYGFKTIEEIYENYNNLEVLSLNKQTLKIEWKPIIASMKRKSKTIKVNTSQTGRMKNNYLKLTPDHKILTYNSGNIISKEIKDVLKDKEMLLLAQKIPCLYGSSEKEKRLAYLLGGLMTDGHVYLTSTHGEVQFIQKPTKEKLNFIEKIQNYMYEIFNKKFSISKKKTSSGIIRGKPITGNANAYRLYSKQIATQVKELKQNMTINLLKSDEYLSYNFLAGVIDGDGTFNKNRINIFCSNENLLQSIIVACLRIETVPQVTVNRNIWNVQIVEKINEILQYTNRVKGTSNRNVGTRFFSAKQVLDKDVNYNFKERIFRNLLIDENRLKKINNKKIKKIIDSDTRMQRVSFEKDFGVKDVYNITVKDNNNYVVFSERYSPIIVNNCHAAIVSRELGIPCVVGTNNATKKIKNGMKVTVSCAEGEEGFVYKGIIPFKINKVNIRRFKKPKTKIMMNVGDPDRAFEFSFIPNDGVGLAREEFIINEFIKIHPKALLYFNKLKDRKVKQRINEMTYGYKSKTDFFINKLAQGIAMIGAAFYPKPVIVRFSDFKTNEYANLIGGKQFEPKESNPMLGWRGASRYYSEDFKNAFALECKTIKKVREEFGLKNVIVMIPFCRTIEEGKAVLKEMEKNDLERGKNNLEVYVMCEIPSNVILADDFSKIFDGFSIGSNDLTQLTLGLDRDSELVAHVFDERNEAVKRMMGLIIMRAHKHGRKVGICGDSPSTYPEIARFLVDCGIDSISLSPDAVMKTTLEILKEEKKLRKK